MELGATVCTPKSPKCLDCPVQRHCKAYAEEITDLLPVKSKPGAPVKLQIVVAIIKNQYGEVLVSKRPDTGLLANFYEFTSFEYSGVMDANEFLLDKLSTDNQKIMSIKPLGIFNHVFSHRIWDMDCYEVMVHIAHTEEVAESNQLWLAPAMFNEYPLVTAHQKILAACNQANELTR
ncbi:MAG: NUDIX domain-containing protein, partial [Turicibacter sp.]